MKLSTALFAAAMIMSVSACGGRDERPEDTGPINFERNSAFSGPDLRVFLRTLIEIKLPTYRGCNS